MFKHELISYFPDWWAFRWNWCATLTFRGHPTLSSATRLFREWIDEIEQEDGASDFEWIRVFRRTREYEEGIHFYVLVRGLRKGSRGYWVHRWQELAAGDAFISYCCLPDSALRYLEKNIRPLGYDIALEYKLGRSGPLIVV